jgi:hypothetical protein
MEFVYHGRVVDIKTQPECLGPLQLQLNPAGVHTIDVHVRPQFGKIQLERAGESGDWRVEVGTGTAVKTIVAHIS